MGKKSDVETDEIVKIRVSDTLPVLPDGKIGSRLPSKNLSRADLPAEHRHFGRPPHEGGARNRLWYVGKLTITEAKSFRPPFSKGGAVKGPRPLSPTAVGETPSPGVSFLQSFFLCAFSAKEKSVEEFLANFPCRPAYAGNAARGGRLSADNPAARGRHFSAFANKTTLSFSVRKN